MKPEIEQYLREHGERYTAEALREQLVAAGHEAAEVDAALDEWKASRSTMQAAGHEALGQFWRWTWAIYGVVWVAVVLLTAGRGAVPIVAIILGIAMLIGVAISGVIGRLLLPSGMVLALIVPVVAALLIGGTCVGMMGGFSNL